MKGGRPTCRNLKWLTHKWFRWRRQCVGGQTAQLTGGGKCSKVYNKHKRMNVFIKEATEHKHEKQELLNRMETLKQKIGKFDDQLRLLKENFDSYVSPQAEADNIEDIPSNIVHSTVNNNLEGIEYDAEQELSVAAADGNSDSVENHYRKLEFHMDSPLGTLPKSGARDNRLKLHKI